MNLKQEMSRLPEPEQSHWPDWTNWRWQLWHNAQESEDWIHWPIVHHCFLSDWLPVEELWPLVESKLDRYGPAMAPLPGMVTLHGYDRNLVRLIACIAFWEQSTGKRIEDLKRIQEVGGGFGALALAIHRLGFRGEYGILDFPEMNLLQRWFLEQHGIPLKLFRDGPCDLLICNSSLSEMPIPEREAVISRAKAESYLFEHAPRYDNWDNAAWFAGFRAGWGGNWNVFRYSDISVEAGCK
jgi:hypothetical protein